MVIFYIIPNRPKILSCLYVNTDPLAKAGSFTHFIFSLAVINRSSLVVLLLLSCRLCCGKSMPCVSVYIILLISNLCCCSIIIAKTIATLPPTHQLPLLIKADSVLYCYCLCLVSRLQYECVLDSCVVCASSCLIIYHIIYFNKLHINISYRGLIIVLKLL